MPYIDIRLFCIAGPKMGMAISFACLWNGRSGCIRRFESWHAEPF